jgi:hypothetical protein
MPVLVAADRGAKASWSCLFGAVLMARAWVGELMTKERGWSTSPMLNEVPFRIFFLLLECSSVVYSLIS